MQYESLAFLKLRPAHLCRIVLTSWINQFEGWHAEPQSWLECGWNKRIAGNLVYVLFTALLTSCPLLKPVAKLVVSWFVWSENQLVQSFVGANQFFGSLFSGKLFHHICGCIPLALQIWDSLCAGLISHREKVLSVLHIWALTKQKNSNW